MAGFMPADYTDLMSSQLTDVDLLVIGAGITGLTAAARAAATGARVALVEKGPAVGGSAQYAGYVWTAESYERMREVNPDGDAELARVVTGRLEDGLDWIRSLDVEVGPKVVILGYGRGCQTNLVGYITACLARVRDHGTVLTDATVLRLLSDEGGVHGAVISVGGAEQTVHAGATLLATGGFGGDPDLRAQHIHPLARDLPLRGNPHSTGDGLRLAGAAGAAFVGEDAGFYGHLVPSHTGYGNPSEFVSQTFYHSEHGILLNLAGRRFCDETVADHLNALSVLEQPEARALLICDERVHREWMLTPYVAGAEAPDKFRMAYSRGARAAIAEDVDELEALPPEWGYNGPAARESLIAFNEQASARRTEPGRRLDSSPLLDPPYYVIEVIPALTNTWGGLRIDARSRVLDTTGSPIPGLLAAGADAGGLFQRAYGGGLAAGLTFAMLAVETALGSGPAPGGDPLAAKP
jgi:succinate dehydrogenase/fumarate reductase flavoprotein subunit